MTRALYCLKKAEYRRDLLTLLVNVLPFENPDHFSSTCQICTLIELCISGKYSHHTHCTGVIMVLKRISRYFSSTSIFNMNSHDKTKKIAFCKSLCKRHQLTGGGEISYYKNLKPLLSILQIFYAMNLQLSISRKYQHSWLQIFQGPCTNHVDRIWGIFDPPPSLQTLLLNSRYQVMQTFQQPPLSPQLSTWFVHAPL